MSGCSIHRNARTKVLIVGTARNDIRRHRYGLDPPDHLFICLADGAERLLLRKVTRCCQGAGYLRRVGTCVEQTQALGNAPVANGVGTLARYKIVDALRNGHAYFRASIHPLLRRDRLDVVGQREIVDRAVVDLHAA
jgi:hypothetical protein